MKERQKQEVAEKTTYFVIHWDSYFKKIFQKFKRKTNSPFTL